jgi:hypothetical protein
VVLGLFDQVWLVSEGLDHSLINSARIRDVVLLHIKVAQPQQRQARKLRVADEPRLDSLFKDEWTDDRVNIT